MPPNSNRPFSNYISASIALSFAGFLNGYDTGSIGAIAQMDQFRAVVGDLSATMLGITVSMVMLTAALPSLVAGQLADKHGRLKIIGPGAALFGVGAILQATAFSLAQFIVGRAISGAGQGMFLANVSVYITEIAPSRRRGRLAAMPQFMAAAGICVGYFCCFGTAGIKSSLAWRLPFTIMIAISFTLALICLALPESPRWLLLHGRGQEARTAVVLLDFDMDEARRDFLDTPQEVSNLSTRQSYALLFRAAYRQRTMLALFILSMTQLSGIDAITYYAPALFAQAGITSGSSSLIASGVSSITMLLISIPAFMLADKWGRRTSTIGGGFLLAGIMILMGSLYASGIVHPTGIARWVVVVSVFLFGMVFCATWGIVAKIYASEIQPGNTRAAANSVGMAFSFFTNWIVTLVTPILLDASAYGAYFLFGGIALFNVFFLMYAMPETRGRSLEDIQTDFRRPGFSNITSMLRPLGFRRRGAGAQQQQQNPPILEGIELPSRDSQAAASFVNLESASRSIRMEVSA